MKIKINQLVDLYRLLISSGVNLYRRVLTSDFIHKVAGTLASKILLMGLTFMTSVLVTRILGPRDRGFYSVAVATAAMGVQLSNLGLHLSNIYYVSKERRLLSSLFANSLIFSFLFGGFLVSLVWLIFSVWPNLAPIQGTILVLTSLAIPIGLAYLLLQNLILGIQKIFVFNLTELLTKFVFLVILFILITFKVVIIETVFACYLFTAFLGITIQIGYLWHLVEHPTQPSFRLLKENLSYGIKAYLAALFFNFSLKTNLLMIQYILGPEQAGYYAVADNFATLVYTFPLMVSLLLFPKISTIESLEQKWIVVKKVILVVSVFTGSFCLLIALFSKPIITLIYGDNFLPSSSVCSWLMPAVFFLSVQVIIMQFNAATGYPFSVVFVRAIGLAIVVTYDLLFLHHGIHHAAIAATISYACMAFLLLWIGRRKVNERVA